MPRGRKTLTPEERLVEIDNQITDYSELIKALKDEKISLEQEIKNRDLNNLYNLIIEKGKTIDEVKMMLV